MMLVTAMTIACGPGTPGTDDPMPTAEWAYGWWMIDGSSSAEWGTYFPQFEIRPDGTVFQMVDYCKSEAADWQHEARWELQPDGSVRLLPAEGEDTLPFLSMHGWGYEYIDLKPGDDSCTMFATRYSPLSTSEPLPVQLERGRWCTGAYLPEFNECELSPYCGEDPPVCE